ncbi:MAG: molybdopterin cofactor-binding domain-containing protein, partial [Pseudomonadota bacterium]
FRIDASGITLITPRADKGQGAHSIQAYLLAEELDIDPLTVALSPGRPDPAYYNGAVLDESAPGLGHFLGKMLGMQLTGGSSTVPDLYERLREAGAVARETLKQVAADRFELSRDQLSTRDAAVVLPDGNRVPYTELAAAAADQSPVTDVTLRDPSQWKYLGHPMPRVDIVDKSTGRQRYGIDVDLPDMVYATVRTNPALGAPMNGYDAAAAEGMRGVMKIAPITGGVAVIADNTWRAFRAANAIKCDWAPGDYPADTDAMWAQLESHLEPGSRDHRRRNDGDVDDALAGGDVVAATYRAPYLAHAPLEPLSATVKVTGDRVDVWTGTQIPRFVEDHVIELTGLAREQVHLHVLPIGGSFGQRLEDTYVKQAVETAMTMPGRPVKMTWTREEDFSHDYPRPMAMGACRGAVRDGKVSAVDMDLVCQSLVTSWFGRLWMAPPGPDATITTGAFDQPYAIDHYRVTGYRAKEMVGVSSWRSVAASQNGFFHECFLDELIHAAGADPVEERLRLCDDPVARRVLEKAAQTASWNGPDGGNGRGRGVALVSSFGVPVAE